MPIATFQKLQRLCPKSISNYNPETSTVKVANGASVTTHGTFRAFKIAGETFSETFLLMQTMNQTILGLSFFENNDNSIQPRTRTLKLPNMTLQLTERINKDGKVSSLTPKKNLFLHSIQNYSVQPNSSEIITCSLSAESFPEGTVAIVEPNPRFERQTGLCVTSAIVKIDEQKQVSLGILNILPHKVTVSKNAAVAKVTILTAKQAQYLHPISPELLTDHLTKSVYGLIADSETKVYPSTDKFWFPTPENCTNPESLTGIHKRIDEEIVALKERETLQPDKDQADREKILSQFP